MRMADMGREVTLKSTRGKEAFFIFLASAVFLLIPQLIHEGMPRTISQARAQLFAGIGGIVLSLWSLLKIYQYHLESNTWTSALATVFLILWNAALGSFWLAVILLGSR